MWFVICFHPFPHHVQQGLPHTSALRLAHFACPFSANLQEAGPHNSETKSSDDPSPMDRGPFNPLDPEGSQPVALGLNQKTQKQTSPIWKNFMTKPRFLLIIWINFVRSKT